MMAHWHACLTRANSEKKAAERLDGKGIETYVPLVPRQSRWTDRVKRIDAPIFPGYVFARVEPGQLLTVLMTPGVASVVHHNGEPAVVRDDEIENVRRFVDALTAIGVESRRTPDFRTGQRVRVVRGPFEGVTGRVHEVRGRSRLLVGLAHIGQGLEVDISADLLEPLDRATGVAAAG